MSYQEKQMAKLERYQELAIRTKRESESVRASGDRLANAIPFGQPILCGHHSEARHRRDIERIHNSMRKSIELSEKSEYYENKVNNILNPTSISSDDENAIPKLEAKKLNLGTLRLEYKRINKEFKKTKDLNKIEMSEDLRKEALTHMRIWGDVYNGVPFPGYCLTNLGGNIRRITERIEHLKRLGQVKDSEVVVNGVIIKVDTTDNRVKLIFDGKPSEEIRNNLKSNGFRWSPYNMAWQRQISDWSIKLAKEIAGGIK